MSKHTPGPWRIDEYRNFVTPDGPLYLGGVTTPLTLGNDMRKGWENARRIVACVNACEGISTENLEENKPIIELARAYNVSLRQRNDLLAALRSAVNDADAWGLADDECDWLSIARAAIAKATGEQS